MLRIHVSSVVILFTAVACSTPSSEEPSSFAGGRHQVAATETVSSSTEVQNDQQPTDRSPVQGDGTVSRLVNASDTHGGVTVKVSQVRYSAEATTIDMTVFVDREFGLGWDAELPPEYVYLLNDFQLKDDQGRLVTNTSGEYGLATSDPSGQIAFDHHYIFDAPQADATELTLHMSSVVIGNLSAHYTIEVSLDGRGIGDAWDFDKQAKFGPLLVVFAQARLREATEQLHSFRLETDYSYAASEFEGSSIQPTCVRMYPAGDPFFRLQDSGCAESQPTSYIEFKSPASLSPPLASQPIQLTAVTDLVVDGPWIISWPIER